MGLLFLVCIITGLWTTLSDPSDPSVNPKAPDPGIVQLEKGKHIIDENYFCTLCKVYV